MAGTSSAFLPGAGDRDPRTSWSLCVFAPSPTYSFFELGAALTPLRAAVLVVAEPLELLTEGYAYISLRQWASSSFEVRINSEIIEQIRPLG